MRTGRAQRQRAAAQAEDTEGPRACPRHPVTVRLDLTGLQSYYYRQGAHRTSHNGLEIGAMCCTSQGGASRWTHPRVELVTHFRTSPRHRPTAAATPEDYNSSPQIESQERVTFRKAICVVNFAMAMA